MPLTCVILVGLFAIQRRGTGSVGALFGPVMVVWFVTIGALGACQIARNPRGPGGALSAARGGATSPPTARRGFLVLGSVVLAVTGGEALYADMGHFGARPIRLAWLALVMPALVLNYFGQGALMLASHRGHGQNPFFAMVPAGPCDATRSSALSTRRDGDRLAGAHLRRVLAHPPGDAARLSSRA